MRSWPSTPRAGRSSGCRRSIGPCCGWAIYELLWREDVPAAVVIDEAVELAKTLSTDESPQFVNGVLARVLRDAPTCASPSNPTRFSPAALPHRVRPCGKSGVGPVYGSPSRMSELAASTCHLTRRWASASMVVSYMIASERRSSLRIDSTRLP